MAVFLVVFRVGEGAIYSLNIICHTNTQNSESPSLRLFNMVFNVHGRNAYLKTASVRLCERNLHD